MSNFLAQSTMPAAQPMGIQETLFLLATVLGSLLSGFVIIRRKLWVIPPVPQPPISAPVLTGILLFAIAVYFLVSGVCGHLMGITPENSKNLESIRKMIFCQPAIQLMTLGVILAMLTGSNGMPTVLQWHSEKGWMRQALLGYVVAIPWVLLVGAVVSALLQEQHIEAEKQHVIFKLWRNEVQGATPFKTLALFSAVVSAPAVEEVVFRGLFQRLMHQISGRPVVAIVMASLAFAATHQPWALQPPVFVLSLFLGWVYFRTGSMLVPILMHTIFNALQFVIFAVMV